MASPLRNLPIVLALLCPVAAAQEQKLDLRLRLKKGETYRLDVAIEQRIDQTVGAAQQVTEQTLAFTYSLAVEEVDAAGNMTVATKYESIRFRQKGPAGQVEYDSANAPKQVPPAARAFAALAGLGFKMTLSPAAQVTAVQGLDAMLAEMVRKLDLPDPATRATVQKVLVEQFGEEKLKQDVQTMFAPYPERPVAVGDSWERDVTVTKGFPATIRGTYTLKGRNGGVAEIALAASVATGGENAGAVELGTGKMTYDLKGEQSGTIKVDEATGWTRALSTEQVLTGNIRFRGSGGAAEVNNPVTMKDKVTVETAVAKKD